MSGRITGVVIDMFGPGPVLMTTPRRVVNVVKKAEGFRFGQFVGWSRRFGRCCCYCRGRWSFLRHGTKGYGLSSPINRRERKAQDQEDRVPRDNRK